MPVETATGVVPKLTAICGMAGEMMVASRISMNSADAAISAIRVGLLEGLGAGFGADDVPPGADWSVPAADLAGRVTILLAPAGILRLGADGLGIRLFLDSDARSR